MIKIKYDRVFDLEDICSGDILIDKQNGELSFAVLNVNLDAEEFICVEINKSAPLRSLIKRIGFENSDDYIKVNIIEN